MRILGIDYGEKRIGLAVSDETHTIARELDILSPKAFFEQISAIITEQEIEMIVVGLPLNMSGQETEKTAEVRDFVEKIIQVTQLPVQTFDERLSSVFAEKIPGGTRNTDSLAAQIILQNYLNTKNKNNV